jgi:predicted CDP-diglyceride synthetase/phosphatidate cytidylyltransferase
LNNSVAYISTSAIVGFSTPFFSFIPVKGRENRLIAFLVPFSVSTFFTVTGYPLYSIFIPSYTYFSSTSLYTILGFTSPYCTNPVAKLFIAVSLGSYSVNEGAASGSKESYDFDFASP